MLVVARSCLAAGAALISIGAGALGPVGATEAGQRPSGQAYTLTASSTPLNIPLNMLNMALSMPAWEVQAMDRLADAMIGTGSWQVWGPTNVVGFDEWDPPKLGALIDMMMPVQPFSSVLGDQANWWAKANLPMNAACAAVSGACPDLGEFVKGIVKVPTSHLSAGYQFPTVTNPFTLQPTSWSGAYVKLDPGAAVTALWNSLTAEPTAVQTVAIGDFFTVPLKLAKAIFDAYYPFVQNSEWFNPTTPFSWVFRALAPLTCPSCEAEPYNNPSLYGNYPPKPAPTATLPAPAAAVDAVSTADEVPASPLSPPPNAAPVGGVGAVASEAPVRTPEAPAPDPGTATPQPGADGLRRLADGDSTPVRAIGVRAGRAPSDGGGESRTGSAGSARTRGRS